MGERAHVCKGSLLHLLHPQVLPIHHLLNQRQQTTSKSLRPRQSLLPAGQRVAAKLAGGGDGDDVGHSGDYGSGRARQRRRRQENRLARWKETSVSSQTGCLAAPSNCPVVPL